jgi:hypothetical protein
VSELDPTNPAERFYTIDADGSFASAADAAVIAGTQQSADAILDHLRDGDAAADLGDAVARALEAWGVGRAEAADDQESGEESADAVGDTDVQEAIRSALDTGRIEAAVLDRSRETKTKFRLLTEAELTPALARYR